MIVILKNKSVEKIVMGKFWLTTTRFYFKVLFGGGGCWKNGRKEIEISFLTIYYETLGKEGFLDFLNWAVIQKYSNSIWNFNHPHSYERMCDIWL